MKVINRQNQHEIGFDIGCLPSWAEYIAMDSDKDWFFYADDLLPYKDDGVWLNFSLSSIIPEEYEPKNYVGSWEDSLFKIDRSEMVNYNGTAI